MANSSKNQVIINWVHISITSFDIKIVENIVTLFLIVVSSLLLDIMFLVVKII